MPTNEGAWTLGLEREGGREGGREKGREGGREGGKGVCQMKGITVLSSRSCFLSLPSLPPFLPPSFPPSLPPSLPFCLPHLYESLGHEEVG